ncbi:MAG: aldehyde dehydrogenase family protein, partial [[Clostridium] fimetarium]|nr:aldehyde dehydrogenase family protein [[Clostridium] fimetarium]
MEQTTLSDTFKAVKAASRQLGLIPAERRDAVLMKLADSIEPAREELLEANAKDLARMDPANPLYDRLKLTVERLSAIAADMRHVASLPSPLGEVDEDRTLPNGLRLRKVRVPFGVVGVVYEARPNVTFDVFSLCFKSGNACVLKGGSDAECSNRAIVELIHRVLREEGILTDVVALLPSTHEATASMLNAVGYVDICMPRGGQRLI